MERKRRKIVKGEKENLKLKGEGMWAENLWPTNEVYEKNLFAGLESGSFKQSKIMHGW